ncbi:tRNA-2-methylthio-N(6)-dimethylallyladenosine synthase [Labeo rohita]|uniref:tRNA-2-methylthio-N(6)-dimethylallyladenosine synthase n=1 Tax=Labeo rohita TaxID=84645 RepID=A0ABQ8L4R5_LABRO|nr:tRNA-2-methylthio-N(6)-dimethylallyladenosine synthase [Labeo rohita]
MAALKQKHILEVQEEQIRLDQEELRKKREHLRREKEQLALEAELKVTNAKLEVLEINSKCASKTSDGMNFYLERSETQETYELNPNAERFMPTNKNSEPPSSHLLNSVAAGVKPKHVVIQPPIPNVIPISQGQSHIQALVLQNAHDNNQSTNSSDILNIMQRQNEITALLVQQNTASALPMRSIPVFDEQYTRGQPRNIVRSCQHLPSESGYQRAKALLIEHFGSEHKISSAYMDKINNWLSIKPEDVNALQSFALFLRGCSNIVHHIKYMKELDMPANLRTILMKLPYKLREKWRNVACDILEQTGSRAVFVDFVNFIEKQVKIVSDPLFGNINDVPPASHTKQSTQAKQKRKSGTFATSVNTIKDN